MMELVDIADSKSAASAFRFESEYPHHFYGGVIAPAGNLVLKTSGTRDGMGIDTSLRRQTI